MRAEIISVPKEADSVVVLFATGLKFRGQEIYLESTGNLSRDEHNKRNIHRTFELNMIDKGIL